jgi:hypothetical protein
MKELEYPFEKIFDKKKKEFTKGISINTPNIP